MDIIMSLLHFIIDLFMLVVTTFIIIILSIVGFVLTVILTIIFWPWICLKNKEDMKNEHF